MWWRTRRAKDADLDAELRAHLEMATQDHLARGESPDDAARRARQDFGDLMTAREGTRDVWAGGRLEQVTQDLRHAVRSLKRAPAFALSATLALAIGIGSSAAMFAIVRGILLEPLPYGHPSSLVDIGHEAQLPVVRRIPQSTASYFTYKRSARSIADLGLYRVGTGNIWVDGETSAPEQVAAAWLTASMLPTLQVSPMIGRSFNDDEDRPNGPPVVIISEGMWRARFGGARDVLGKTLYVNSVPRQIIGVMPNGFHFPTPAARIWLPSRIDANTQYAGDFGYSLVARLRPDVTPLEAQRDLATILPRMAASYPTLEPDGMSTAEWLRSARPIPVVVPLRDTITGEVARTLWMLAVAAGLVLFVACASVANLVLIRADERQVELAVREALGAGRLRAMAQFYAESTLLSVTAGVLGLAAAWVAVRALVRFGPSDLPRLAELDVDVATMAFTAAVSLLVALVAGVIPMLHGVRANSFTALRENGRTGSGRARHRLRRTIAGLQIALALVVLTGSGLLLRTFQRLRDVRPGFDATNVTTLWMQVPFARQSDSGVVRFYAALAERARHLPGVVAVGLTGHVPLGAGSWDQSAFSAEGGARQASLRNYPIDDGYLAAMRIPLIAGKPFDKLDRQRSLDVVVSRQTAELFWGDTSGHAAVGKRLTLVAGGSPYTVIGVANDVRDDALSVPPTPTVYLPQVPVADSVLGQRPRRTMALIVRTAGAPGAIVSSVKRIVHDLDPTLPTFNVQSMSDVLDASTARLSMTLVLMGAATVITLVLGAIGLYGVTAYVVALRRRELGLRIALGAEPRRVVLMMTHQGVSLAVTGVVAGMALFLGISRFLRTFLYGVAPSDPVVLLGAVFALLLIAALASWLPARRIAQIDPADALRSE